MNKKAQITIFVILGMLLVVMILLFLMMKKEVAPEIGGKSETNVKSIFESCLEEKVKETVNTISKQGGYIRNPLNITFKFKGSSEIQDISYLCYTTQGFLPCINQEPLIINHLQDEIKNEISSQVRLCFDELASNLEKKGETVEAKYNGFTVTLYPRKIVVDVDGEITSTKSEQTTTQKDITGNFQSRLYEIAGVAQEIVSQEATYCSFDNLGYMLFYPEFEIDKDMTRDSTNIYTIKHAKGIEKFSFAIRSCSFPPGF